MRSCIEYLLTLSSTCRYEVCNKQSCVYHLGANESGSNVAGATKKSCMAAAIFVAYCVGNIVGPQLIKSETKKDHYPELWTGLIIW